jgi:ribosomal protein S18 acetylase RimI-like enzyme
VESFKIRDAVVSDIPALARLHVAAWNETYPGSSSPPTVELRERQWREAFALTDGSWFAIVIEDRNGQLVGFAKGKRYRHEDLPQFSGELNKLYVLKAYHRRGLGRQLVSKVASHLLSQGVTSMVLFSEVNNPAGGFFTHLGAEKIFARNGDFHGTYGWQDLSKLIATTPP